MGILDKPSYTKPLGGIPKTDLATAVQSSLDASAALAPRSWRQSATRCSVPDITATANKQTFSRTYHVAADYITSIKLGYVGGICAATTETLPGAAATVRASIEMDGSVVRVNFSGATDGTIPIGGLVVSDEVTLPRPLRKGEGFYVRTWQSSAWGIMYNVARGSSLNTLASLPTNGQFLTFGVTTPDLTGVTTLPTTNATNGTFGPALILSNSSNPALLVCGDSRTRGQNEIIAGALNAYAGLGNLDRRLNKEFATLTVAISGETAANVAGSNWVFRALVVPYFTNAVIALGINDVTATTPAATILDSIYSFINGKLGGIPSIVATIEPRTSSTDNYLTTTNQTKHVNNGIRVTFNQYIRQGLGYPIVGYIENADAVESGRDSGLWKPAIRIATDGVMTSGSAVLTSATANFSLSDVGRHFVISGAGAAGVALLTNVASYTSQTSVTLAVAASTTVSAATIDAPYTNDGIHATKTGTVAMEFSGGHDALGVLRK